MRQVGHTKTPDQVLQLLSSEIIMKHTLRAQIMACSIALRSFTYIWYSNRSTRYLQRIVLKHSQSDPCFDYFCLLFVISSLPQGSTALSGPGSPHYLGFTMTYRQTALGRTPLDEDSARRRDLSLTTHNICNRGFQTAVPRSERSHIRALDRAVTGIGFLICVRHTDLNRSYLKNDKHILNLTRT